MNPAKNGEKPEEKIEIIPSEPAPKPVEIEVDPATGKPVSEAQPAPATFSAEEFRKLESRLEYQRRQDKRELLEALGRLQQPQPTSTVEKPEKLEDFDQDLHVIAQTNYQKAIAIQAERVAERITDKKFKDLMEKREKEQRDQNAQEARTRALESSKAWVLQQAPELNDESSETFKSYYSTYSQMLAENPGLAGNPLAPEVVYGRMVRTQTSAKDTESERLKRVIGTATPQGRPISQSKTVKLTQEEIDMCKQKGLSPAVYAQMKDANFKEGVTA